MTNSDGPKRQPVTTTIEQVLTGLPLGLANLQVHCTTCNRALSEGDPVTVYAYRRADDPSWQLCRCYCADCAPDRISTPTLGVSEVLATAIMATVSYVHEQTHSLCLAAVEVVAFSPPSGGADP